jgi:hypothetical protein
MSTVHTLAAMPEISERAKRFAGFSALHVFQHLSCDRTMIRYPSAVTLSALVGLLAPLCGAIFLRKLQAPPV